jgi:hypothetical protein
MLMLKDIITTPIQICFFILFSPVEWEPSKDLLGCWLGYKDPGQTSIREIQGPSDKGSGIGFFERVSLSDRLGVYDVI